MTKWLPVPLVLLLAAGARGEISRTPSAPPEEASLAKRLAGLKLRCIGPYRGGRVAAVTGVPGRPLTFYFGGTGGGVFRTNDAGAHWEPISDKDLATGSVGAIAVAESDPNVVYAG